MPKAFTALAVTVTTVAVSAVALVTLGYGKNWNLVPKWASPKKTNEKTREKSTSSNEKTNTKESILTEVNGAKLDVVKDNKIESDDDYENVRIVRDDEATTTTTKVTDNLPSTIPSSSAKSVPSTASKVTNLGSFRSSVSSKAATKENEDDNVYDELIQELEMKLDQRVATADTNGIQDSHLVGDDEFEIVSYDEVKDFKDSKDQEVKELSQSISESQPQPECQIHKTELSILSSSEIKEELEVVGTLGVVSDLRKSGFFDADMIPSDDNQKHKESTKIAQSEAVSEIEVAKVPVYVESSQFELGFKVDQNMGIGSGMVIAVVRDAESSGSGGFGVVEYLRKSEATGKTVTLSPIEARPQIEAEIKPKSTKSKLESVVTISVASQPVEVSALKTAGSISEPKPQQKAVVPNIPISQSSTDSQRIDEIDLIIATPSSFNINIPPLQASIRMAEWNGYDVAVGISGVEMEERETEKVAESKNTIVSEGKDEEPKTSEAESQPEREISPKPEQPSASPLSQPPASPLQEVDEDVVSVELELEPKTQPSTPQSSPAKFLNGKGIRNVSVGVALDAVETLKRKETENEKKIESKESEMGSERETEKEREGLGVISPPSTQPNSPSPSSSSSSNTSSTTTSINQPSSLAVLSAVANEVRTVPEETAVSESSSTSASSASLNINAPEFTPRIPLLSDGRPKRIRCHFWPFCANEGVCIYWHPSELCKNEELYGKGSCMFGTKCFFVHAEDLERLKNGPPPAGPTNSTTNPNASGTSKKNGLKDSSTPGTGNGTGNKRRNGNKYNGTRKQRFRNASQSQQHNLPYAPSHLQPPSTYPQEYDYEFDYTAPYAMVAQEEGVISASQFVPVLQGVHQHPHQPAMNVPVSVPMSLVDPAIAGTQYHSNGVAHETAHLNLGNINSNSTENETSTLNMESEEGVVSGLCHVPVPSHPHQHAHVNQYQYTQHPGSHRPNNLEIVNAVNGYNGYGYTGFEVNEYGYDVGEIGLNGNNINGVSGNGFEVSVNNEEGTV